jgi:succinyl-CoA synthetase alpha subunit
MSILVDRDTRLCVSGITGREGTFHTLRNRDYGTRRTTSCGSSTTCAAAARV